MQPRLLVIASIFGASVVAASLVRVVEPLDGSFVVRAGDRYFDVLGSVENLANDALRQCSDVKAVSPASQTGQQLARHLSDTTGLGRATLRQTLTSKNWLLAEAEFSNGEPGIFLLQAQESNLSTALTYGGTAAPFDERAAIRAYLLQSGKGPEVLARCFEPAGAPFR